MRLRLHLVRHGQSDWNLTRRVQGRRDEPVLTALGREQAEAAARLLATEPVTAVLSSDLTRARQTAVIVASALGLPVVDEPALREQSLGVIEGMTQSDALTATVGFDWTDVDASVPDGESLRQVARRLEPLLTRLRAGEHGNNVVLVSHGDALRVFDTVIAGADLARVAYRAPANGSVSTRTECA